MTNENRGEDMSAAKRKRMLIGFAGLAVVLVAVIALVSPTFRNEDASGAIGAVQKHRETQIKPSDVVLGSETARREAKVLYGDYLTNAAKLQSQAVEMVAAVEALNDRAKVRQAEQTLNAYGKELAAQYVANLDAALLAYEDMLAQADEESLGKQKRLSAQADIDAIQARSRESVLAHEEMLAYNRQLRAVAQTIDSADVQSLASMESDVAAALANKKAALLDNVAVDMESRIRRRAVARHYTDSLEAFALAVKKVRHAENTLESFDGSLSAESRTRLRGQADDAAAALAAEAQNFESRALRNMEMLLQFDGESAAALAKFSQLVRNAENAENRARLRGFDQQIENFGREVSALAAFDAQDQFLALRGHLAARDQYFQRLSNFEVAELAAFQLANARGFEAHLANLDVSVAENKYLANAMPDPESFAMEVKALMNKGSLN